MGRLELSFDFGYFLFNALCVGKEQEQKSCVLVEEVKLCNVLC